MMTQSVDDQPKEPQGSSPVKLDKRSWKFVSINTVRQFMAHQCTDAAASLTYYALLAMFPALIAVFSLLGLIGEQGVAAQTVLGIIDEAAPSGTADTIREPVEQLAKGRGAGIALVFGLLVAIWSASKYVGAFSRVMNRILGVSEGRPFWKLRPMQLIVTLIIVTSLAIIIMSLVLSGPILKAVSDLAGLGPGLVIAWKIGKWPLLAVVVVFLVAILYYATPNAKQPKFRWVSFGAFLAIAVLVLASLAFGLYIENFASYERTYGSMAGVVIFLLWVWIANIALLFGAEFDAELERGRQLQSGVPAEESIQLPLRDTTQVIKRAAKDDEMADEGRKIRVAHADDD